MISFGYNNRWVRLVKDLLFVALCVWLVGRGNFFVMFFGAIGLYWYGRDAWFQAKALWQDKHYQPAGNGAGNGNGPGTGTGTGYGTGPRTGTGTGNGNGNNTEAKAKPDYRPEPDDKITVTNLSDAKEVDFEKE